MRGTAFALAFVALGCAGSEPQRLTRVVGGERRQGVFVSPHAYEQFIRAEYARARACRTDSTDPAAIGSHFTQFAPAADVATGSCDKDVLGAAVRFYRGARTGPADDPLVIARLADTLDLIGESQVADRELSRGLEAFPSSEALWLSRGDIAARRTQTGTALESYRRASAIAPKSARGPLAMHRLLRSLGADGRAQAVLERYLEQATDPTPDALRAKLALSIARGNAQAAAATVSKLLEVAPAKASEVVGAAEAALDAGWPELSLQLLASAPRPMAITLRVRALLAAGRFTQAEALLASVPPHVFGGLSEASQLFLRVGRPERALDLAHAAHAVDPSPKTLLAIAEAALALDRAAEAAKALVRIPPNVTATAPARVALATALRIRGLQALANEIERLSAAVPP